MANPAGNPKGAGRHPNMSWDEYMTRSQLAFSLAEHHAKNNELCELRNAKAGMHEQLKAMKKKLGDLKSQLEVATATIQHQHDQLQAAHTATTEAQAKLNWPVAVPSPATIEDDETDAEMFALCFDVHRD